MTAVERPTQAVLNIIRAKHRGVSFVQIAAALDAAGVPANGDQALYFGNPDHNVILWPQASQELVDAITGLLAERLIEFSSTSPVTYMIDGRCPTLPVAKSAGPFKQPRWLPVVFNAAVPGE